MRDCMYELAAEHEGGTIAAVSHGMAIKILLMGVLGIHSGDGQPMLHGDNTSVSLLQVDHTGIKAVYYNDNSHLSEELSHLRAAALVAGHDEGRPHEPAL